MRPLAFLKKLGVRRSHAANPPLRFVLRRLCHSGRLSAKYVVDAPVTTVFELKMGEVKFSYLLTPGDVLGSRLYWEGEDKWEPHIVPLYARFAHEAPRVLDIGAHTGVYTLLACSVNPSCQVVSFEPLPPAYERLVRNVRHNGFETRCKALGVATSDACGTMRLTTPADPTMCSLGGPGEGIDVPLVTVDGVVPKDGRTRLAKIDVEGHEDHVLRGMAGVIEDSHPVLIFECNPGGPADSIERILRSFGYLLYSVVDGRIAEISRLVPTEIPAHNHNFVAMIPPERPPIFSS